MACLLECQRLLKLGSSVLFFPEGTRSTSGRMAAFKKVRHSQHRPVSLLADLLASLQAASEIAKQFLDACLVQICLTALMTCPP